MVHGKNSDRLDVAKTTFLLLGTLATCGVKFQAIKASPRKHRPLINWRTYLREFGTLTKRPWQKSIKQGKLTRDNLMLFSRDQTPISRTKLNVSHPGKDLEAVSIAFLRLCLLQRRHHMCVKLIPKLRLIEVYTSENNGLDRTRTYVYPLQLRALSTTSQGPWPAKRTNLKACA